MNTHIYKFFLNRDYIYTIKMLMTQSMFKIKMINKETNNIIKFSTQYCFKN